jgi:RNA polymerase sigma-70 factor (ECF subfamily)
MPSTLKETIDKIKAGDQSAFRQLVESHQQYAYSLAFRILCEEEEARDCVQESFIKTWKNIQSYKSDMKFTTWLYKIVTNTALDRYRKLKRLKQVRLEDSPSVIEKLNHQDTAVQLDNKELGRMIRLVADGLPEKQNMVFVLRDIQGLNPSEVAEILEIPETAVKSNLYHARKAIRNRLEKIINYERRSV